MEIRYFDRKAILISDFVDRLEQMHLRLFGGTKEAFPETIRTASVMAMEVIATCDALYHNMEHSMMVTLVGQDILHGKHLLEGSVTERDWVHAIISLLCHDIGYVKGICPGDEGNTAVIDEEGRTIEMPAGATGAFLAPYHVERGKMFVRWRFRHHPLIDSDFIATCIEATRFPVPESATEDDPYGYPSLVRAADLIGQLADPDYLRKLAALYFEFEETGINHAVGCESPEDLRESYPNFYWNMVSRHIGSAVKYLRLTREGREWQAGLYSHVFSEQHRHVL